MEEEIKRVKNSTTTAFDVVCSVISFCCCSAICTCICMVSIIFSFSLILSGQTVLISLGSRQLVIDKINDHIVKWNVVRPNFVQFLQNGSKKAVFSNYNVSIDLEIVEENEYTMIEHRDSDDYPLLNSYSNLYIDIDWEQDFVTTFNFNYGNGFESSVVQLEKLTRKADVKCNCDDCYYEECYCQTCTVYQFRSSPFIWYLTKIPTVDGELVKFETKIMDEGDWTIIDDEIPQTIPLKIELRHILDPDTFFYNVTEESESLPLTDDEYRTIASGVSGGGFAWLASIVICVCCTAASFCSCIQCLFKMTRKYRTFPNDFLHENPTFQKTQMGQISMNYSSSVEGVQNFHVQQTIPQYVVANHGCQQFNPQQIMVGQNQTLVDKTFVVVKPDQFAQNMFLKQ